MSNDAELSPSTLVQEIWASHFKVVGAKRYAHLAANPKEALRRYQNDTAQEPGLRFNLVETLQLLAAALELANSALEIYKTLSKQKPKVELRALDSAVREAVANDPQIAPLLDTAEYKRLITHVTSMT